MCYIINLSLNTATVPSEWKHARVVPIYKSGSISKVDNYRPISILPALSKILEKAVHTQLSEHLESNKLLTDSQFGYRPGRSTQLAATLFLDNIRKEVDRNKLVGAVFIDLSKAFDTLGHSSLLSKLPAYGIQEQELNWMTDYLFQRRQNVSLEGQLSIEQTVTCGVPQGSILGPLLFLIYFNDFQDNLKHSKVIEFADDTVIYCSRKNVVDLEDVLNQDLEQVSQYFYENELIANLKKNKTESILFGTSQNLSKYPTELNLLYRHSKINFTKRYKYLGTIVDPTLALNDNFNNNYKKASSRLRLLSNLRLNLTNDAAKQVYENMILPLLLFNSTVKLNHTMTQKKKLDSLHNRALTVIGHQNKVPTINNLLLIHSCLLVRKCLKQHAITVLQKSLHDITTPTLILEDACIYKLL